MIGNTIVAHMGNLPSWPLYFETKARRLPPLVITIIAAATESCGCLRTTNASRIDRMQYYLDYYRNQESIGLLILNTTSLTDLPPY
jgi:hypothetical protein